MKRYSEESGRAVLEEFKQVLSDLNTATLNVTDFRETQYKVLNEVTHSVDFTFENGEKFYIIWTRKTK